MKHFPTYCKKLGTRYFAVSNSNTVINTADMPPGTDCPYPIGIFAFFEMIRPYHVVIRI